MNSLRKRNISWKVTSKVVLLESSIKSTETKRMMATASFTIPSPKRTLNSLGYFSGLIIVSAATESVAQMVAENIII